MNRAGLSYLDWAAMTQWQRADFLLRHYKAVQKRLKAMEDSNGISGVVGGLVLKLLGG